MPTDHAVRKVKSIRGQWRKREYDQPHGFSYEDRVEHPYQIFIECEEFQSWEYQKEKHRKRKGNKIMKK